MELKRQFVPVPLRLRGARRRELRQPTNTRPTISSALWQRACARAGQHVTVVTRDKDLAQLIRPGDEYWDYIGEQRFRYDQIADRFGVQPERMACFLALMGDAVDNIPGVPGVGRKTAVDAVPTFRVARASLRRPGSRAQAEAMRNRRVRRAASCAITARRRSSRASSRRSPATCRSMRIVDRLTRRPPDLDALNDFYDAVGFGRLLRNQAERITRQIASLSFGRRPPDFALGSGRCCGASQGCEVQMLTALRAASVVAVYRCTVSGVTAFSDRPCAPDAAAYRARHQSGQYVQIRRLPSPDDGSPRQPTRTVRPRNRCGRAATTTSGTRRTCERLQNSLREVAARMRPGYSAKQGEQLRASEGQAGGTAAREEVRAAEVPVARRNSGA